MRQCEVCLHIAEWKLLGIVPCGVCSYKAVQRYKKAKVLNG